MEIPSTIPAPAYRGLTNAGYDSLEKLAATPEKELLKLHGVGPKAIRILKEIMQEKGVSFPDAK